jgi:methylthioribose-1-phosphate isomerase
MWGNPGKIRISNPTSPARNPAFDVTPAKYITGYITEIGLLKRDELEKLRA